MIATGLHQQPFGHLKFYWRLRDHAAFLGKIGVEHVRVEPALSAHPDPVAVAAYRMHYPRFLRHLDVARELNASQAGTGMT